MFARISILTSLVFVSQFSHAQIINSQDVLKQTSVVRKQIQELPPRLPDPRQRDPFALSSLPPIESVTTEPLSALPATLAIGPNLSVPVLVEAEVEDGWRAVQRQWIGLADAQTKATLVKLGARIEDESSYPELGLSLLRFTVPASLDSRTALARHLSQDAMQGLDRNHIYQAMSPAAELSANPVTQPFTTPLCANPLKLGMIDSGINLAHPAFTDKRVLTQSFLAPQLDAPNQHGTAVAGRLIGETAGLQPLLGNATLYAAQVFYRQSDYAQGATLSAMLKALNWMVKNRVAVVNMSLAGPDNRILARAVTAAVNNHTLIVAAAGNEGPAAAAVYPAGYSEVIAVSAIDQHGQPYRWSNRGDYVDFSALGVNVLTAQANLSLGMESGTSMAAPVVAAALACNLASLGDDSADNQHAALSLLASQALDLGTAGKDPIYGLGAILYPASAN